MQLNVAKKIVTGLAIGFVTGLLANFAEMGLSTLFDLAPWPLWSMVSYAMLAAPFLIMLALLASFYVWNEWLLIEQAMVGSMAFGALSLTVILHIYNDWIWWFVVISADLARLLMTLTMVFAPMTIWAASRIATAIKRRRAASDAGGAYARYHR